jgi:putative FmdB family regulatory protein
MIYSFQCSSCESKFDKESSIDDRNKPLEEPCPSCGQRTVKRSITSLNIVHQSGDTLSRTDSGWNDMLKRIKKSSGKDNTIQVK